MRALFRNSSCPARFQDSPAFARGGFRSRPIGAVFDARAPGFPHAGHLWPEAMGQVACGWLAVPPSFDSGGSLVGSDFDAANVAFRFPVLQWAEIRAFDDFTYGLINLCEVDLTPITLPTWGHIVQISAGLSTPPRKWSFEKADRKAEYRNLTLNPDQSQFRIAAHRSPGDSKWRGVAPLALLVGASAAVRHYSRFPRIISMVISRLFGLPLVNYFDDPGSMAPPSLSADGIRLLADVCGLFRDILEGRKTDLGRRIALLGSRGHFSGPDTDLIVSISLSDEKDAWAASARKALERGLTPHKELGTLSGDYHFPKHPSSDAMTRRRFNRSTANYTRPGHGRVTLSRRAGILPKRQRIAAARRPPFPGVIIYTGATAGAVIMASVVIPRPDVLILPKIAPRSGVRASGD